MTLILAHTDHATGKSLMCADTVGPGVRKVFDKLGALMGDRERQFAVGIFGSDVLARAMHIYRMWETGSQWTAPVNSEELAKRLFELIEVVAPSHRLDCVKAIERVGGEAGARLEASYKDNDAKCVILDACACELREYGFGNPFDGTLRFPNPPPGTLPNAVMAKFGALVVPLTLVEPSRKSMEFHAQRASGANPVVFESDGTRHTLAFPVGDLRSFGQVLVSE